MAIKLKPGAKVSGYEVVRELSNGAFAISYEAKDQHGQRVFFKNYKSPSPLVPWFKGFVDHQGELKRRVESDPALKDRCYRFVEFFTHGPSYCQVFEFIDQGMALTECIERKDAFDWGKMVVFAKVMMFAIKYLHTVNIVHTDLKPDNIMLIPDTGVAMGYKLRLVDMDWAILSDKRAPWHGVQGYIGTPGYQSPEHLKGEIPLEASDIFTCGIMLSEMLGEGHPYSGSADDLHNAVLSERYRPFRLAGKLPKVEDHEFVERVINACFSADHTKRPTASQIAEALAGKTFPFEHAVPSAEPAPVPKHPSPGHAAATPADESSSTCASAVRLSLLVDGDRLTSIGVDSFIGKANFRQLSSTSDARFLSDPQFELKKTGDGWVIVHCKSATNETIVNGSKLEGEMLVRDGMVVAVGNSSKGIEKFPIVLQVDK